MKDLFKKSAVLCLAACLVIMTAACGGTETGSDESGETSVVTLNVWHQWASATDVLKKQYNEIVSEYEEENPGIRINTMTLDTEAYKAKIPSEFAGDASDIDIFFFWANKAAERFIKSGKLLPLDDYLPEGLTDKLTDGSLNNFTYDGKIYALPMYSWCLVLFCNKTVFEEAGAKLPETYTELLEAVQKIKAIGKIPIASGARDSWNAALIYQALAMREVGAENVNAMLKGNAAFGSAPGYYDAAAKVKELYEAGAFGDAPLDESNDDGNNEFITGRAAMRLTGSWYLNTLYYNGQTESGFSLDTITAIPVPMIEGKGDSSDYCGGFVDGFFVNKNTVHKQEAVDFVAYLSEKMGNNTYEGKNGFSAWKTAPSQTGTFPLAFKVWALMKNGKTGVLAWDTALPSAAAQVHNEETQSLFTADANLDDFIAKQKAAIDSS